LRFVLAVCAGAAALALTVSLFIPKQYTATASIAIDPPAGNDPRGSTVVSPMYFESLKAYELMAASDTVFLRGAEKFHLHDSGPVEALKRRILKVTKVRDTKILQITVTLPDPKSAQEFAKFLAEQTVELTRADNYASDEDLLAGAHRRVAEAQQALEREQADYREFARTQPAESLRADLESLTFSREGVERDLTDMRAQAAELSATPSDSRIAGMRARLQSLESQDAEMGRQIQVKAALSSERDARADELSQRLKTAQTALDSAAGKLHEVQATAGTRGDRLRVVDPGVVPEQPSAPNLGLNVALALAVAFCTCLTFLTLKFRASA
jgi:capsule polysaccharide export protein KpsE/RkpR